MPARTIHEIGDLARKIGRPVRLMEVCGTHTMAAFRTGFRSMLPSNVALLSGPGCPVCVTTRAYIDHAVSIARAPGTAVATFGDMMRVPGSDSSLERARAGGGDVRVVYSPSDALAAAEREPGMRMVFLGVGFETTIPAVAWTIKTAAERGVGNYSVLCGHKTIPEAMEALLRQGESRVDGFMCPGHVSVITGSRVYEPIASRFRAPCVVAGFEAADMAAAVRMLLVQILEKRAEVEVQYTRSVNAGGNAEARRVLESVFEKDAAEWRGLGVIPGSGLKIREKFAAHDAGRLFPRPAVAGADRAASSGCLCGDILRGVKTPADCPLFATRCAPASPVGPCMVSSEGTCAAHYKYGGRRSLPVDR